MRHPFDKCDGLSTGRELEVGVQRPLLRLVVGQITTKLSAATVVKLGLVSGCDIGPDWSIIRDEHPAQVDRLTTVVIDFNPVIRLAVFVRVRVAIAGHDSLMYMSSSLPGSGPTVSSSEHAMKNRAERPRIGAAAAGYGPLMIQPTQRSAFATPYQSNLPAVCSAFMESSTAPVCCKPCDSSPLHEKCRTAARRQSWRPSATRASRARLLQQICIDRRIAVLSHSHDLNLPALAHSTRSTV